MSSARDSRQLAVRCARFLDQHKLEDIAIFEVGAFLGITDYFVIATGRNSRHLRAASDKLLDELRGHGIVRRAIEGYKNDKWVLVDLDDAVVHLFGANARRHYDLELLWGDCPKVDWQVDWQGDVADDGGDAARDGGAVVEDPSTSRASG